MLFRSNAADASTKRRLPDVQAFAFDDGFVATAPVGRFRANGFGLHDMTGNAFEWCLDRYSPDFYAQSRARDPNPAHTGGVGFAVLRGGGWRSGPQSFRSADRSRGDPEASDPATGFRVARMAGK